MPKPRLEREQETLYCASCGVLGLNTQQYPVGTPLECPNNKFHLAEVVKSPSGEFWLRVERRIWKLQEFSPLHLFRFGGRAGLYHFCRALLLVTLIFIEKPKGLWPTAYLPIIGSLYLIYDVLLLSTYATFVSRNPAHPLRSLTLNLSSFFQCGLGYAVFFKSVGGFFSHPLSSVDSIYFSIVTISTVGFGDISVSQSLSNRSSVELLIVSEIGVGLYILAGLIAVVASWANQRPSVLSRKVLVRAQPRADGEVVVRGSLQPTIAVDFDGVIADYNGWEVTGAMGSPRADVIQALHLLRQDGWRIIIYSCRASSDLLSYLSTNNIPFDELNQNSMRPSRGSKPAATVYWDDRAFPYSGNALKDIEGIRNFRTWNGRR